MGQLHCRGLVGRVLFGVILAFAPEMTVLAWFISRNQTAGWLEQMISGISSRSKDDLDLNHLQCSYYPLPTAKNTHRKQNFQLV